jgi:hypothetical protein
MGKVLNPLDDVNAIRRVASVLSHFATLRYNIPGSLYGYPCRGLLFPETEDLVLIVLTGWRSSLIAGFSPITQPWLYRAMSSCSAIWISHLGTSYGRKMALSASLIGHLRASIQDYLSSVCSGYLMEKMEISIRFFWSRSILYQTMKWRRKRLSYVRGETSKGTHCKSRSSRYISIDA